MVANVKELNAATTELKKVSALEGEELAKFTNQAYEAGESVAKTGTQMVEAATEWKKAGYDEKQILQLSKVSSMYQNISDSEISAGEATNFIISQLKAFNKDASESEHIIDAVNNVSNNMAISSYDLATNIGKASAAMSAGGNTYEQTLAMMTGITEITRSGSKAARGLVSIQSRYNQILDESSSTGKKLSEWYEEHGIQIKDSDGQLKSFYDTSSQVAKIWDTLSDNEKKYYANIQAGATQTQNLMALYSNYEGVLKATGLAEDSVGSAAQENEKYLDSIQGKLQAFQSAWEQLSFHVVSSNFLTDIIETGTNAIKVFDDLAEVLGGPLTAALGGAVWIGIPKVFTSIFDSVKENGFEGAFKDLGKDVDKVGSKLQALGQKAKNSLGTIKEVGVGETFKAFITSPVGVAAGVVALIASVEKLKKELSFEGELEDVTNIESTIGSIKSEINELNAKGDKLNESEKSRLTILEAQLKVQEQQLAVAQKEATDAFEREAASAQNNGLGGDVGTDASNYLDNLKRIQSINAKIAKIGEDTEMSDTRRNELLEQYSDELTRAEGIQAELGERIIEQEQNLSKVDYNSLSADGKAYYDSIHSAFLAMQNDNVEVQEMIQRTVEQMGSAKFDALELDISSFKTAEEYISALKEKLGEDTEVDVEFIEKGAKEVEERKKEAAKSVEGEITFSDNGTIGKISTEATEAAKPRSAVINFMQTGLGAITSAADALSQKLQREIGKHASGKPKGAQGGLSWLGDEGDSQNPKPEMVVSQDGTAELVGTQGWELRNLKSSDIVYSYAETKKLLGGKNSFSGVFPRYASGKNQKKIESLRDKYDDAVDTLDFQQEYNKLSQATYVKKLKSVYNSYTKKLKAYNSKLTTDQIRDYKLAIKEPKVDAAEERIDSLIGAVGYSGKLSKALKKINSSQKNKLISSDDAKKLRAEAHKQNIDYIAEEVKAGRKSYSDLQKAAKKYWNIVGKDSEAYYESLELLKGVKADMYREDLEQLSKQVAAGTKAYSTMLNTAKKYWKEVGKGSDEYYESLDMLREAEIAKTERLRERREDEVSYAEQYIRLQISELERQQDINKSVQEEADARAELAKAQNTYVKVYREGIGWTYERDAEAIKEANKALNDLNTTKENNPIQYQIDKYNEVLDLFDKYAEEADFIELQNKLGVNGIEGVISGSILDKDYMANWLQTQNTRLNGYDALITQFENMSSKDYEKYVNTGIDMAMRNAAYKDYAYISGSLYNATTMNAIEMAKAQQNYLNAGVVGGTALTASQVANAGVNNYYFGDLHLPNITDAQTFLDELQSLTNSALQSATKR